MHMHGLHYRQKSSRFFHQKKILVDFKNALIEKTKTQFEISLISISELKYK